MGTGDKKITVHQTKPEGVQQVCSLLMKGEVVALPTETVYGLAGNALEVEVVKQIFAIKMRPLIDPLIVHFHKLAQLDQIAHVPEQIVKLANAFWPGPLTIILEKKDVVPDLVTAGRNTVGVRMPANPWIRKILAETGLFLAAPSANPFGYVSPTRAQHVVDSLGNQLGDVLDGGDCDIGLESTIVEFTNPSRPSILRMGPISRHSIQEVLGVPIAISANILDDEEVKTGLLAPGTLSKHYSPKANLILVPNGKLVDHEITQGDKTAEIYFQRPIKAKREVKNTFWLSEHGDKPEAAKNLFHLLREMDKQKFGSVLVEMAPCNGIGDTINDRLRRAAAKSSINPTNND